MEVRHLCTEAFVSKTSATFVYSLVRQLCTNLVRLLCTETFVYSDICVQQAYLIKLSKMNNEKSRSFR